MFLSFGGAVGALSTFARNIIIARLISVEDFGIAATFGITMALVQMSTGLGVDRLIVQATDGNEPKLQATVQAFNILRGVVLAIIMYAVASPIAHLFDLPELIWAFQWLAILPLITGFVHMDAARFQREMKFGPSVLVESIPQIIAVALSAPLALYFKDYRVMLWIITAQAVSTVVLSFIVAKRRYSVAIDREFLNRIFSFGWPLMLNGILLFGIFQADRGIVGIAYSMEDLGWFSAAFTLTLFPSMVFANAAQSFFMPMLSKVQDDPEKLEAGSIATIKACLMIGITISVGLSLAGPAFLLLLFGSDYVGGVAIIAWLALMQGIRMAKAGPTIVAISCGQTKLPLYANIVRSFALVFALIAVWQGWGVLGIVIGGIIGETMAVIFFLVLLSRKFGVDLSLLYKSVVVSIVLVALAIVLSSNFATGQDPVLEIAGSILLTLVALGIFLLFAMDLVKWLKQSGEGQPETQV
ncbi:oligosaccharide flippase family protein [Sneathiella litorea]|uniref:Oligosaccharide flippase family protein n=1 Tax=Sneathiella litorea TaxID=2606216 RepID=A0A6L8W3S9_9PROT|nr:oligosaccharide flippase family protein [Sneathiella litorea]MZR29711.1 oligosaccharide flippase family protein [Sneathiella litorea]